MQNGKQGKNCCCLRRLREHHFACSQRWPDRTAINLSDTSPENILVGLTVSGTLSSQHHHQEEEHRDFSRRIDQMRIEFNYSVRYVTIRFWQWQRVSQNQANIGPDPTDKWHSTSGTGWAERASPRSERAFHISSSPSSSNPRQYQQPSNAFNFHTPRLTSVLWMNAHTQDKLPNPIGQRSNLTRCLRRIPCIANTSWSPIQCIPGIDSPGRDRLLRWSARHRQGMLPGKTINQYLCSLPSRRIVLDSQSLPARVFLRWSQWNPLFPAAGVEHSALLKHASFCTDLPAPRSYRAMYTQKISGSLGELGYASSTTLWRHCLLAFPQKAQDLGQYDLIDIAY